MAEQENYLDRGGNQLKRGFYADASGHPYLIDFRQASLIAIDIITNKVHDIYPSYKSSYGCIDKGGDPVLSLQLLPSNPSNFVENQKNGFDRNYEFLKEQVEKYKSILEKKCEAAGSEVELP